MSTLWKAVSVVTLVAVLAVGAAVVKVASPPSVALAANGNGSDDGITISAQGMVRAKPDVAQLSLGVSTEAATAKEAMDANSETMAAVLAKLEELGIAKKDIQTGHISLYPQMRPVTPEKGGEDGTPTISGYMATNSVNVTLNDLSQVGVVLDGAVTAGANTVNGVSFGLKDDSALRDKALTEAIKLARSKADLVAKSLGLKVTGVENVVVESYIGMPIPYAAEAAAFGKGGGMPVPVEAGEITLTANVRITFDF